MDDWMLSWLADTAEPRASDVHRRPVLPGSPDLLRASDTV